MKNRISNQRIEELLIVAENMLGKTLSRKSIEAVASQIYENPDLDVDLPVDKNIQRFLDYARLHRKQQAQLAKKAKFSWQGYPVLKPSIPPIGSPIEKHKLINSFLDPWNRHRAGSMTVALGYNCPLSCRQCYITKFIEPDRRELTPDEFGMLFNRIIDEAGVWHIDITGGEPLEHPHFFDIIDKIPKDRATAIVATSGRRLTKETVERICRANILAFKVSLSSCGKMKPDQQEEVQQIDSETAFDRVMNGIGLLLENKILTFVQSYVEKGCSENDSLEKMILSLKDTGIESVHLITPLMTGNLAHNEDKLLSQKDREYIYELQYRFRHTHNFRVGIFPDWELEAGGCAAGRRRIYISAYGDVFPCNFHNEKCYGNILKDDLKEMISAMQEDIPVPPLHCIASNVTRDNITQIRQKITSQPR